MSQKAFKDPVEFAEKVDAYFAECESSRTERELKSGDIRVRQTLPSFVGLAVYLGVVKSTLLLYADGKYDLDDKQMREIAKKYRAKPEDIQNYSTTLARARDRMELATLDAASDGDTDSRITLSRLARYGYSTKVETESKAVLSVQWEGASLDEISAWGK